MVYCPLVDITLKSSGYSHIEKQAVNTSSLTAVDVAKTEYAVKASKWTVYNDSWLFTLQLTIWLSHN